MCSCSRGCQIEVYSLCLLDSILLKQSLVIYVNVKHQIQLKSHINVLFHGCYNECSFYQLKELFQFHIHMDEESVVCGYNLCLASTCCNSDPFLNLAIQDSTISCIIVYHKILLSDLVASWKEKPFCPTKVWCYLSGCLDKVKKRSDVSFMT